MAQQIQQLSLVAPAFRGLNTQDSPIDLDPSFALVADNCVVDQSGRLGARKGNAIITTDKTELGSDDITAMWQFTTRAGDEYFYSVGNNKIMEGKDTLVDVTPSAYTITADHWQIDEFNDAVYFFQKDHDPLVADNTGAVTALGGSAPQANCVLSAFGRLWAADITGDRHTLYFSDTLRGDHWTTGSSGNIDLTSVWPNGTDNIVGLASHNNFLVIFGETAILIYQGAEDPATMTLADEINGIGCIARDSIRGIGTDLLFLSREGLRSLGRTIQEKSVAIGDLSRNIKNEIQLSSASTPSEQIKAAFMPTENLYVLSYPLRQIAYAFDVRQPLETGAYRVTRWTQITHTSYHTGRDGSVYIGSDAGIGTHSGFLEKGNAYRMFFQSPQLSFGDTSKLKMLKNISAIFIGGGNTSVTVKWGYGFTSEFKSKVFNITGGNAVAYFGESEFNIAEFSTGTTADVFNAKANGSGTILNIALEAQINGSSLSIQGFNIQTLLGKITNG